jgi:hypothetical protein
LFGEILRLALTIVAGIGVCAVGTRVAGIPESRMLFSIFRRR